MEEKLYNLKELAKIYGVNRKTLLRWVDELNFPLFTISPYKRYAREGEMRKWERTCYKTGDETVSGSLH